MLSAGSFFPVVEGLEDEVYEGYFRRMYALLTAGVFIWFIYRLLPQDIPIIAANLIGFAQALSIYILKMKYK